MTFNEAKNILNNISDEKHDEIQRILEQMHSQAIKQDKKIADAIELASMALMLYCKK